MTNIPVTNITVFVTHKSEDIETVEQFIRILQGYDVEQRLIFERVEEMSPGRDWRQHIQTNVVQANVLFFLMISPAVSWEWCIYEAGLFVGSRRFQESTSSVITFYDPDKHKLPLPLKHLQAVKTNQVDIQRFLKKFYGTIDITGVEPPINPEFARDVSAIPNAARNIYSILRTPDLPRSNQTTFPKEITLSIENSRSIITREDLLNNIRIRPQTPGAMEIFDLDDASSPNDGWSWGKVNNFPLYNRQECLGELADSIYSAHDGRVPKVVQSTFRAPNGKLYRPILYNRIKWTDDSEQFTVLFVEQISEGWVENAPSVKLATLLTASILGARLQWGVCNRYLRQLDHLQQRDLDAIRSVLKQVKTSFTYIDEDARIRSQGEAPGQRNEDRLRDSFDSEDEQQIITNNMREQEPHKEILREADKGDVHIVRVALTELARLNPIVTAMVARRYSQLLNENSS